MKRAKVELVRDFQWLPHDVAVSCPVCGAEAMFVAADVFVRSNARRHKKEAGNVAMVGGTTARDRLNRRYGLSDRRHHVAYRGLGHEVDPTGYASDGSYLGLRHSLRGTAMCRSCHAHSKVHLRWPEDAHFQTEYAGRQLWFYSRGHVVAMLALLRGDRAGARRWDWWFDRQLPTVFKTARARKHLPPKLKKVLRT